MTNPFEASVRASNIARAERIRQQIFQKSNEPTLGELSDVSKMFPNTATREYSDREIMEATNAVGWDVLRKLDRDGVYEAVNNQLIKDRQKEMKEYLENR